MSAKGVIPSDLLRPIVRKYLDEYVAEQPGHDRGASGTAAGSVGVLADEAKVAPRRLRRMMSGESQNVSFDMADRLLCAMNLVWLWHTPPLADVYRTVELDIIPVPRGAEEPVTCERFHCGHEATKANTKTEPRRNGRVYHRCRTCHINTQRRCRARKSEAKMLAKNVGADDA